MKHYIKIIIKKCLTIYINIIRNYNLNKEREREREEINSFEL